MNRKRTGNSTSGIGPGGVLVLLAALAAAFVLPGGETGSRRARERPGICREDGEVVRERGEIPGEMPGETLGEMPWESIRTPRESGEQDFLRTLADSREFARYEDYGLTYDRSLDHLMYNGEIVGYFHDETAPGVYTHVVDDAGSVGIRTARDGDWYLTGLSCVEIPDQGELPVQEE